MRSSEPKEILETFRLHRTLTMDLLKSLGNEQLACRPIKASGSFGKQFRHILDIQRCYVDSIFTGVLDFKRDDIDHSLESDRDRLLKSLREEDRRLESGLSDIPSDELLVHSIDCSRVVKYLGDDNNTANIATIISWMTEHEIFHEGGTYIIRQERKNEISQQLDHLGTEVKMHWVFSFAVHRKIRSQITGPFTLYTLTTI